MVAAASVSRPWILNPVACERMEGNLTIQQGFPMLSSCCLFSSRDGNMNQVRSVVVGHRVSWLPLLLPLLLPPNYMALDPLTPASCAVGSL